MLSMIVYYEYMLVVRSTLFKNPIPDSVDSSTRAKDADFFFFFFGGGGGGGRLQESLRPFPIFAQTSPNSKSKFIFIFLVKISVIFLPKKRGEKKLRLPEWP